MMRVVEGVSRTQVGLLLERLDDYAGKGRSVPIFGLSCDLVM